MFTAAAFSDPPKIRVKKDWKDAFYESPNQVTHRNASAYSTFDRIATGGSVDIPMAAADPAIPNTSPPSPDVKEHRQKRDEQSEVGGQAQQGSGQAITPPARRCPCVHNRDHRHEGDLPEHRRRMRRAAGQQWDPRPDTLTVVPLLRIPGSPQHPPGHERRKNRAE